MTPQPALKLVNGLLWIDARPYNRDDINRGHFLANVELGCAEVSPQDLNSLPVVIDTRHEGQGQREYNFMLEQLAKTSWFDAKRCFWVNNVFVESAPNIISLPWHMANHWGFLDFVDQIDRNWSTESRKNKFVCLMRRESPSRTRLAIDIIKRFKTQDYMLSCSSMMFWDTFDREHNIKFPILIDGRVSQAQQHSLDNADVFDCLINAIVETSNQRDAEILAVWDSLFITEKTFKAFAWHQIPIWFAVPGTVDKVRSVGFDVFDDLLNNHDYDNIADQDHRFDEVLKSLKNLLNQDRDISSLLPRFQYNRHKLTELNHNPLRDDRNLQDLIHKTYSTQNLRG